MSIASFLTEGSGNMIIAAYAGTGKTTFCNKYKHALDFYVMPFKYENYYEIQKEHSGESIKAADDLQLRFGWQYIYYDALLKTIREYPDEIIVIPTEMNIMNWLKNDGIPFTIVYPDYSLKDEYERRFIKRGNSESFINVFIGMWKEFIERFEKADFNNKVILKSDNQYLSDVIKVTEARSSYIEDKSKYIDDLVKSIEWDDYA